MLSGSLLLTACGDGPVDVDVPDLDTADRTACEGFVDDLPRTLADQDTRETDPHDALAAAYGDPAIVVVCGVDLPPEFNEASACEEVNDVGWFAPPEQYDDQGADVTMFAVTHRPVVELRVPADYRPDGLAAALAQLTDAVQGNLDQVEDCL